MPEPIRSNWLNMTVSAVLGGIFGFFGAYTQVIELRTEQAFTRELIAEKTGRRFYRDEGDALNERLTSHIGIEGHGKIPARVAVLEAQVKTLRMQIEELRKKRVSP